MHTENYTQLDPISDISTDTPVTQESKQVSADENSEALLSWKKWLKATGSALPTFIAIHLAAFVISCTAILFVVRDFSPKTFPLYTLWHEWNRWDTGNFTHIADFGYTDHLYTAFFPLYPFLIKYGKHFTFHNSVLASLVISNIADLVMLIVFYQLVREEFGKEQAQRAIIYLSIFPTAFFFLAGYNESLFLCFTIMLFYCIRHKSWWLAGVCGVFAMLSRSAGILLVLPFLYEYLRQRQFQIRKIRFDILSVLLIPGTLIAYACYCYYRFGDFLSFANAQLFWTRRLVFPGYNLWLALNFMHDRSAGFLSFMSLRTLTDFVPDIFAFALLMLAIFGPWRLRRDQMVYVLYGLLVFTYAQMYPIFRTGMPPLEALSRYLLEVFPIFIVLAIMGKNRMVHQCYLLISGALFFFLLTQFLTGHWII